MKNENNLLHLELRKLMQDRENLDYDKIRAVLSKSSAAREEMFIERLKLKDEISNILTPEQREALKAKAKDRLRGKMRLMRDRMQSYPRFRGRIRR
jgi:Spy/CpxP family protein refolding chaperone